MSSSSPLAILVKGWPRLSETFIAQELVALEELGVDFEIWSLRHPTDIKRHPLHDRLKAKVNYLPEYLYQEPERVWAARDIAQKLPGYAEAYKIWRADLRRDPTTNRIRRFGQACVLAAEMPDAVLGMYSHFLHTPSSVARYAAIMRGMPWSFAAHAKDIWTSPDWEISEKLSSDHHGACFGATCTAFGAKHLQEMSSGTPVDLIYHGLDLTRFPKPPERVWRGANDPLKMMSVGRLVEKKGFDNLIAALALLPADLDWHFTHIGGGALGEKLQAQAAEAGIGDRITWRGPCDQPEVIEEMRASDLFVLPSRVAKDGDRDGLPNVLMEAASQRLPILSTPVSAIPEFIDSGTHGILSSDVPADLAEAITTIAATPTETAERAEAALARLRHDFGMMPGIIRLKAHIDAMLKGG